MTIRLLTIVVTLFTASMTAAAQQTWWGLWNTTMDTARRMTLFDGTHDHYVRLTAQNSPLLIDGELHAVRLWIYDKTVVTEASVWVSTAYPLTDGAVRRAIPLSELRDVLHDGQPTVVTLDEPVGLLPATNPYASIFVGFTQTVAAGSDSYLMAGAGAGAANSNYYNGRDVSTTYGALALQVVASGPRMAERRVTPWIPGEQVSVAATTATIAIPMSNMGRQSVSSIDYVVSIDGQPQAEQHCQLAQPMDELGVDRSIPVAADIPATTQEHRMAVSLTRINGEAVEATDTMGTVAGIPLIALDRPATKRTVMEEFTGTWCLNCVRGMVGIGLLSESLADRFIPIAVHGDDRDPMMIGSYYQSQFFRDKMRVLGGYPSCTIDRRYDCDPYCGWATTGAFTTDAIVAEALQRPAVADLTVEARWDAAQQTVNCSVKTRFGYSSDDAHYRLALVVTADGLQGEGNAWRQRNGYNDYSGDDPNLLLFAGQGVYLTSREFNHVAISAHGVDGGFEGSIASPLVAGQEQTFSFGIDLAGNPLVQDKNRLMAIALLFDTRDGTVVNAAQTHVEGSITGIDDLQTGRLTDLPIDDLPIYDLGGRRIAGPGGRGIIIKDGKKISKVLHP